MEVEDTPAVFGQQDQRHTEHCQGEIMMVIFFTFFLNYTTGPSCLTVVSTEELDTLPNINKMLFTMCPGEGSLSS